MPFAQGNVAHLNADRAKQRRIKQRLVAELEEADAQGMTKLAIVARAIIQKAMEGDVPAFNAIADRVDGKVPQPIAGDDENPLLLIARIERLIV